MDLARADFDTLQSVLLELYRYQSLNEFHAAAPRVLARLVPCEVVYAPRPLLAVSAGLSAGRGAATGSMPPASGEPGHRLVRLPSANGADRRDRLVFDLVLPHFMLACANARRVSAAGPEPSLALEGYGLTPREADVARWLALGKTNAEIARILCASARTIEKHVQRVLAKLRVENRTAAALKLTKGR